jgi:hypothetical protein
MQGQQRLSFELKRRIGCGSTASEKLGSGSSMRICERVGRVLAVDICGAADVGRPAKVDPGLGMRGCGGESSRDPRLGGKTEVPRPTDECWQSSYLCSCTYTSLYLNSCACDW